MIGMAQPFLHSPLVQSCLGLGGAMIIIGLLRGWRSAAPETPAIDLPRVRRWWRNIPTLYIFNILLGVVIGFGLAWTER